MAPRRRRATFNDDLPRRIRFEKEAREVGLEFVGGFSGTPRLLRYRVPITVPIYDEPRKLAITLGPVAEPGAIPDVLIDAVLAGADVDFCIYDNSQLQARSCRSSRRLRRRREH
jgi:hypothetical protein